MMNSLEIDAISLSESVYDTEYVYSTEDEVLESEIMEETEIIEDSEIVEDSEIIDESEISNSADIDYSSAGYDSALADIVFQIQVTNQLLGFSIAFEILFLALVFCFFIMRIVKRNVTDLID